MAVTSNSAVSEASHMSQFNIGLYSVSLQPTNDCTCPGNRPTAPAENVLSVCLVNSKRTFTLQLVY